MHQHSVPYHLRQSGLCKPVKSPGYCVCAAATDETSSQLSMHPPSLLLRCVTMLPEMAVLLGSHAAQPIIDANTAACAPLWVRVALSIMLPVVGRRQIKLQLCCLMLKLTTLRVSLAQCIPNSLVECRLRQEFWTLV